MCARSPISNCKMEHATFSSWTELAERGGEGWDRRNLQEVDYWHHEGELEAGQDYLLALLENRFGSLPEELIQRIRAVQDAQQLRRAFQQALHLQSLDDLQLYHEATGLADGIEP
jgi:hypothetical protein